MLILLLLKEKVCQQCFDLESADTQNAFLYINL